MNSASGGTVGETRNARDVNPSPLSAPRTTKVYSRNVLISGARLAVYAGVGLLLPAYLTKHLSSAVYGGWVLILQIASYIGYLDFGIQTAIAKYIAQHAAAADHDACDRHASAGTAITLASGMIGLLLSMILALSISHLFKEMPTPMAADAGWAVFLVGGSTALLLASSAFAAIFLGFQRYAVPSAIAIVNKLAYSAVLVVMVAQHRSLTVMGASVAGVNALTALLQILAWRLLLPRIKIRPSLVVWPIVKKMLAYCAVLGIWTSGMLIITGLDTTIVGHFDFAKTAFYAVAAMPVTFLSLLLQAALNPLMPAVSAASVRRTPEQMGDILLRSTRYIMLLLELTGVPLSVFGFFILSLWVGPLYASNGLQIMRILIFANIIRNLCGPYSTMVIATGTQRLATLSGVCEAVVNLLSSIVLGRIFGAIGVAEGTLLGAFVGVAIHFLVSMRKTQKTFAIAPMRLIRRAVVTPSAVALPVLVLLPLFWRPVSVPHTTWMIAGTMVTSLIVGWAVGLTSADRMQLLSRVRKAMPIVLG